MADRIPPELFANILRYLPGEVSSHHPWKSRKRLLGVCSLTCRYWAKHIRPFIFSNLTLKSRVDMQSFLDNINEEPVSLDVGLPVKEYVNEVYLLQIVPSDPWIPLLLNFTPRRVLPKLAKIEVLTSGSAAEDDSGTPTTAQSLYYQDFPHALPATHIWRLHRHSITSVRFRSFKDVLAVVTSFDSARTDCIGLTWLQRDTLSPTNPPAAVQTAPRWAGVDKVIRVQGCTTVWPFVWCVVTTRRSSRSGYNRPLFIEQTHLPSVLSLVRCVTDSCTCSRCVVPNAKDILLYRIGKFIDPEKGSLSLRVTVDKGEFAVHTLTFRFNDSGLVSDIALAVDLDPIITSFSSRRDDVTSTLDWKPLGEHATALGTSVANFTFDIQAVAASTTHSFVSTVKSKMLDSFSVEKLAFRHRSSATELYSAWDETAPGADVAEATLSEDVQETPEWYLKW